MKSFSHLNSYLLAILIASATPVSFAQDILEQLVVPVNKPSVSLSATKKSLISALSGIKPEPKADPKISESGSFILYGNLFKTGHCFALVEIPYTENLGDQVALAEWSDNEWQLRGLWKISPIWRPKNWEPSGEDYLPVKPATQPFILKDLSGDGIPEVIIASDVEKYYQEHYLFRFDRNTHSLRLLANAMAEPEQADKYVRLHFNSSRRAIFGEWRFFKWAKEELIEKASWHDETPYNNIDPSFVEAETTDAMGNKVRYRAIADESDSEFESAYILTRDGQPFAKLIITWNQSLVSAVDLNPYAIEQAWLFEKLTKLSRSLYPAETESKKLGNLEDHASVKVIGNEAAKRLFYKKN